MSCPDEERLTKTEHREQARAHRKALEEAERAHRARRKGLILVGGALGVLVVVPVVAIIVLSVGGGGQKAAPGSGALVGLQTTRAPWAPEEGSLATRLGALNLPIQNDGAYHVHAALQVYVDGQQVPVPDKIGIEVGPRGVANVASLHTHDTKGIIHIESSERYPFTLGQFFTIWGVKFTSTQLGGYRAGNGNVLAVYADGKPVANPVGYTMSRHVDIVVGYGKPGSFPTSFQYNFAAQGI